jgi:ubiquinone/menaquinone biosynthesis C-methylase UbiE
LRYIKGYQEKALGEMSIRERHSRCFPRVDNPRILDIGCGTGGSTLELARLSGGEVIGIDIHQPYLNELRRKTELAGLSERVKVVNCSLFDMHFPVESFDIIWAEGSIFIIGFEKGLNDWQRFIKPNGFLVVHEMAWLHQDPPQEIYDYDMKPARATPEIPDSN